MFEGHERDVALLRAAHGMSRKWPEKPSGMTVGAECVIPRTLSGAVMLQKCNISVTRLLQKPGIIVSIRPHSKRQFPSNSNNCVYLLIYAVMNVDNVVKLA